MRLFVYPYKLNSVSGRVLARALDTKRLRSDGKYRAKWADIVINWGNSTIPVWYARILNQPEAVKRSVNKLRTFSYLSDKGISTPEWKCNIQEAQQWAAEGHIVYCRTHLSGHSGSGIVIATTPDQVVPAPLYTKQVKASHEYRVHVFKGEVIDFQQKKRRNGAESNPLIRNHGNGYVYARNGVDLPDSTKHTAIAAVAALGLDFGAVDIAYVEDNDTSYVYEVNTAPGLVGTTISKYTEAFKKELISC